MLHKQFYPFLHKQDSNFLTIPNKKISLPSSVMVIFQQGRKKASERGGKIGVQQKQRLMEFFKP